MTEDYPLHYRKKAGTIFARRNKDGDYIITDHPKLENPKTITEEEFWKNYEPISTYHYSQPILDEIYCKLSCIYHKDELIADGIPTVDAETLCNLLNSLDLKISELEYTIEELTSDRVNISYILFCDLLNYHGAVEDGLYERLKEYDNDKE